MKKNKPCQHSVMVKNGNYWQCRDCSSRQSIHEWFKQILKRKQNYGIVNNK